MSINLGYKGKLTCQPYQTPHHELYNTKKKIEDCDIGINRRGEIYAVSRKNDVATVFIQPG